MHQVATGSGQAHPFIIPLTKIDVERRLVIGTAAEEIADKSREIMDYASARPQFESWSKEFSDATGGLSKGNLRVMHTKHVAGRLDDIAYDDQTKRVQICAKVVDDNDWQKCLDGVYTGFSIGGGYLKKWKDPDGLTRYTPIIREISLVDNPCLETAKFAELVKADGIVGQVALVGQVRTFAQEWAARPAPVPTFADSWVNRPQTFGELHKAFDESKVHRNRGRFASASAAADDLTDEDDEFEPSTRSHMLINTAAGAAGGAAGFTYTHARNRQRLKLHVEHNLPPAGKFARPASRAALGALLAEAAATPIRRWADKHDGADPDLYDPERDGALQAGLMLAGGAAGAAVGIPFGSSRKATEASVRAGGAVRDAAASVLRSRAPKQAEKLMLHPHAVMRSRMKDVEGWMRSPAAPPPRPSVPEREVSGEIIAPPAPIRNVPALRKPKVADFDPRAGGSKILDRLKLVGQGASKVWRGLSPKGRLAAGAALGSVGFAVAQRARSLVHDMGYDPPDALNTVGDVGQAGTIATYATIGGVLGHEFGGRLMPTTRQVALPSNKLFRVAANHYPLVGAALGATAIGGAAAGLVGLERWSHRQATADRAAERAQHAKAAEAQRAKRAQALMGKLAKGYDGTKHPREHDGQFASKTGERVGRVAGGAAGAIGGAVLGLRHGASVGQKAGYGVANAVNRATRGAGGQTLDRVFAEGARRSSFGSMGSRIGGSYGHVIGGAALGLGGFLAGSYAGAVADAAGRRHRAVKAGKLEQYQRLNADVSIRPNNKGQVKRAVAKTKTYANKAKAAHEFISQMGTP